jgi:hypothetical protein
MSAPTVLDTKDAEIAAKNAQIALTVNAGAGAVLSDGRARDG